MALPLLSGEFGVVADPDLNFTASGKARAKLRVIAKDRKKDANGNWVDGEPWFGDIIVWDRLAQNVVESVKKGDTVVIVNARLEPFKFMARDGSGEKTGTQYVADSIGLSMRWKPCKSGELPSGAAVAVESLGATEISEPPF